MEPSEQQQMPGQYPGRPIDGQDVEQYHHGHTTYHNPHGPVGGDNPHPPYHDHSQAGQHHSRPILQHEGHPQTHHAAPLEQYLDPSHEPYPNQHPHGHSEPYQPIQAGPDHEQPYRHFSGHDHRADVPAAYNPPRPPSAPQDHQEQYRPGHRDEERVREEARQSTRDRESTRDRNYRDKNRDSGREWYDQGNRDTLRREPRQDSHGPQIQVFAANQPPAQQAAPAQGVSAGDTMQMLVMNQMMMQQMQAQQMQAAQMASLMGQNNGNRNSGGDQGSCGGGGGGARCGKRQSNTLVNIQGSTGPRKKRIVRRVSKSPVEKKRPAPHPVAPVVIAPLPQPVGIEDGSGAFDNWQEATVILCLMIFGLIYLISSRASAPPAEDKKSSAKHLVGG